MKPAGCRSPAQGHHSLPQATHLSCSPRDGQLTASQYNPFLCLTVLTVRTFFCPLNQNGVPKAEPAQTPTFWWQSQASDCAAHSVGVRMDFPVIKADCQRVTRVQYTSFLDTSIQTSRKCTKHLPRSPPSTTFLICKIGTKTPMHRVAGKIKWRKGPSEVPGQRWPAPRSK